jgi:hypothetical protein
MIDAEKIFFKNGVFVFYEECAQLVDLLFFCFVFCLKLVNFVLELLEETQVFLALKTKSCDLEADFV